MELKVYGLSCLGEGVCWALTVMGPVWVLWEGHGKLVLRIRWDMSCQNRRLRDTTREMFDELVTVDAIFAHPPQLQTPNRRT